MSVEAEPQQFDLLDYLRVLWRRKWTVAVVVVAAVAATLGFSYVQTPRYTATAEVLVQPASTPSGVDSNAPSGPVASDQVPTQIQILQSAPVRDAVVRSLGSAPAVSVSSVSQTDIIDVSATSTDPHRAAAVANAYANAGVGYQRSQAVNALLAAAQQIQSQVNSLNSQIAALDAQVAAAPSNQRSAVQANLASHRDALTNQVATFKAQLAQVQVNSALVTGSAQVVAPAAVPTAPSSPQKTRNALLALAVGLVLGVGAAFFRDYLDDSVKTKEDLERVAPRLPVLGVIPAVGGGKVPARPQTVSLTEPTSHAAEAYRSLRTSIQFLELEHRIQMLQVTSPSAAEGKTTTVANLGVALAGAGQQVIMVCCDLRRPRIHEFFGLTNVTGFTSLLRGIPLPDAIQPVPGEDRLALLSSGPLPPNPSELLVSRRATDVFKALKGEADVILIDSPPVLPVTDAAALSAQVDAVLLVVTPGLTTRKQVARSLEPLSRVKAPVIGAVLNGVTHEEDNDYAYQYGYYREAEEEPVTNGSSAPARRGGWRSSAWRR